MVSGEAPEFRMLGPLTLLRDGQVVPISAARQRAVLAVLLLSPGRYVSRDLIIDQVWNGAPPDGAVKTVQSYVSRLRALLAGGPARIAAGHDGRAYALQAAPETVDAHRFAELVAQGGAALDGGDPRRAADAFGAALALWRDRPLADLADQYRFADFAARRFETLRATAVEGDFRAAAALGTLAARVDELDQAVRAHPDRAGLRELQLRALSGAGRVDDALTSFRAYRSARLELGLDPEPAIADLHRRILQQDPTVAGPPAVEPPGFVGRAAQLTRLREALVAAHTGRGRCVLLEGEAGLGKTTLAGRLVDQALGEGVLVAAGSPHDTSGSPAFRPWAQVLHAIAAAGVAGEAVQQARAMLTAGGAPGSGTAGEGPAARERQFDAVLAALRAAAAARPLLVLLDDVHEADASSVKLLLELVRLLPGSRILLLAAARPAGDHAVGEAWADGVERLRRLPGVQAVTLPRLGRPDVRQLVAHELGRAPDPELLEAVAGRAGGSPLFVVELTRLLADEEALAALRRTGRLPVVPPLVRDAVRLRARLLPARSRQLLSFAAVLGFEFEVAVVRAAEAGHSDRDGFDHAVQVASERRFIEPHRPGVLRFCHPLVHEALYDEVPQHEREKLHLRAVAAIERTDPSRHDRHAERLAQHWRQVPGPAARRRAYQLTVRAGEQAAALAAWEEAARLGHLALDLDDRSVPEHTAGLLLWIGRLLLDAGDHPLAARRLLDALALAPAERSPELFTEIVLTIGESGTFLATQPQHPDQTVQQLRQALELAAPDTPRWARLAGTLGTVMIWASDGHTAASRAGRDALTGAAVRLARRLGDRDALGRALLSRIGAIWRPDNPRERLELSGDLVRLGDSSRDTRQAQAGRHNRCVAALELGQAEPARADARAYAVDAAEGHHRTEMLWSAVLDTSLSLLAGDYAAAEAGAARSTGYRAQWEEQRGNEMDPGLTAQALLYHRDRGRLPQPIGTDPSQLERTLLAHQRRGRQLEESWQVGTALYALATGRREQARELYEEVRAAGFDAVPFGAQWIFTIAGIAELCAAFDDTDSADRLRELLAPYLAQTVVITFGFGCLGSVAHFAGQLAGVLGDWKEADSLFQVATEANRRLGAPPLVARTQVEHARALLRSGVPGERERAAGLLRAATATAGRLDLAPLLRAIQPLRSAT